MKKERSQELFNTIAEHLMKQNAQSINEDGNCLYKDAEGRKCAVGCLIPDDLYDAEIEGRMIVWDGAIYHLLLKVIPDVDREGAILLRELQKVHDRCYLEGTFGDALRAVVTVHDLDLPECLATLPPA